MKNPALIQRNVAIVKAAISLFQEVVPTRVYSVTFTAKSGKSYRIHCILLEVEVRLEIRVIDLLLVAVGSAYNSLHNGHKCCNFENEIITAGCYKAAL